MSKKKSHTLEIQKVEHVMRLVDLPILVKDVISDYLCSYCAKAKKTVKK